MHYEQLGPHGQGLQAKEVLGAYCTRGNRKHNITKFIMPFVKSKIYIIFIAFYVFFQLGINFEIFLLIKKEFKKLIS